MKNPSILTRDTFKIIFFNNFDLEFYQIHLIFDWFSTDCIQLLYNHLFAKCEYNTIIQFLLIVVLCCIVHKRTLIITLFIYSVFSDFWWHLFFDPRKIKFVIILQSDQLSENLYQKTKMPHKSKWLSNFHTSLIMGNILKQT